MPISHRRGASDGGLSVNVASPDYARFAGRAREFPRRLRGDLRRELRAAARAAERDLERAALALRLPGKPRSRRHRPRHTGLRQGVARSVRVVVREAGDGIEARVTASHMGLVLNAAEFRHPIFEALIRPGEWNTAAVQESQPWWDLTWQKHRPKVVEAGRVALRRAVGDL